MAVEFRTLSHSLCGFLKDALFNDGVNCKKYIESAGEMRMSMQHFRDEVRQKKTEVLTEKPCQRRFIYHKSYTTQQPGIEAASTRQ
jgi:hypothetical protein